ncbi:protein kinase domain-containing protein [Actinomycetota bacterium]
MPRPDVPGYQVGSLLGQGSSGQVWSGVRLADRREVAIKVVLPGSEGASERALREFSILQRVAPEHLVPFVETVELGEEVAIVLGRVDGGTLGQVLSERGYLSDGEAVTAVSPIATALGHLHQAGIVHGDVSPGNVLFDRTGRPVLADLGLARLLGERQPAEFATPGYVAPELLSGGAPSPAADVYSIGALLWFALSGEPPGIGGTRRPLEEVAPRAGEAVVAVARRLIASDPHERPTAREAASLIFDAAPPEPIAIVAGPSSVTGLTRRLREEARDLRDLGIPELKPPPAPAATRGRDRVRALGTGWSRPRHGATSGSASGWRGAAALARFGALGAIAMLVGLSATIGLLWAIGARGDDEVAAGPVRPANAVAPVAPGESPITQISPSAPPTAVPTPVTTAKAQASATPITTATAPATGVGTAGPTEASDPGGSPAADDVRLERDAPESSPSRLLQALVDARAKAWERADPGLLAEAVARDSPAWREDEAQIDRLLEQRVRLEGVELSVRQAGVEAASPATSAAAGASEPDTARPSRGSRPTVDATSTEVLMTAVVRTGKHVVLFADGRRATRPQRDGGVLRVGLRWTGDGWRIATVAS